MSAGNDASVCSLACLPLASIIAALHKPLLLGSLWTGVVWRWPENGIDLMLQAES